MSTNEPSQSSRRAKNIFGDCALVEIIHLHDCFRGALTNLEHDVSELCREISAASDNVDVDVYIICCRRRCLDCYEGHPLSAVVMGMCHVDVVVAAAYGIYDRRCCW